MKVIFVEQDDAKTAKYPDKLRTEALGTCVGVAVISGNRGFLLHSSNPDRREDVTDPEQETDIFFKYLDMYVAQPDRPSIRPVVAGAVIEKTFDDPDADDDLRQGVEESRRRILRFLKQAGFGRTRERWAKAGETHSLELDLKKRTIRLDRETSEFIPA
jgi:hypothetical protein